MTPEGKIFQASKGFLSSDDLLDEIKFAHGLFAEMQDSSGSVNAVVQRAHRDRLEALGYSAEHIEGVSSPSLLDSMDVVADSEPASRFSGKSKRQILMGNRFSIKYPMMDYRKFEKDPTPLVGSGKSSFVSTRSDGVTPKSRVTDKDDFLNSKEDDGIDIKQPAGFPKRR